MEFNLTQKELREILWYDPETGIFIWLKRIGPRVEIGKELKPSLSSHGYLRVRIYGELYYCHRLAWFYMTAKWPEQIDHKDLNRTNNKWNNLRDCSNSQNHGNIEKHIDNTSGYKGVYWDKKRQLWIAQIMVKGDRKTLGGFTDKLKAKAAYDEEALNSFKEFARS